MVVSDQTAQVLDIKRNRGDTFPFVTTVGGGSIDITAYTFELTVDPSEAPVDATNNLFTLTGTVTDGPNGKVQWELDAAESDQTPNEYYHDIEMIDGSSYKRTIAKGSFTFEQDITK